MATFVRVVEAGSFAGAARGTPLTPAMIGRHVLWLEERLGVQLIARTTRRQSVTEAGRAFYDRCKTAIAEVDAAEEAVLRLRKAPRGVLRINAPVTFGADALTDALPAYLQAYPEVRVELTLDNRIVDLAAESYDAVFRVGELSDSTMRARTLSPYRLVVCAAPSYLARRGWPTSPKDLTAHACLGFRPGAKKEEWTFDGPGGTRSSVAIDSPFVSNNGQALRVAALAGVGIIAQSEALVRDDIARGSLVRVLPDHEPITLPLHVLFSPTRTMTPKLRTFLDFATRHFGKRGAAAS